MSVPQLHLVRYLISVRWLPPNRTLCVRISTGQLSLVEMLSFLSGATVTCKIKLQLKLQNSNVLYWTFHQSINVTNHDNFNLTSSRPLTSHSNSASRTTFQWVTLLKWFVDFAAVWNGRRLLYLIFTNATTASCEWTFDNPYILANGLVHYKELNCASRYSYTLPGLNKCNVNDLYRLYSLTL